MKGSDVGKAYAAAGIQARGISYEQARDYEAVEGCRARAVERGDLAPDRSREAGVGAGWSHEEIAQDKALAQEISQIQDPKIRAKAQRLLSGIKQEAEARQPRKELGKQLEKGFGLGDD